MADKLRSLVGDGSLAPAEEAVNVVVEHLLVVALTTVHTHGLV